jgi:hypothetical protein
MSLRRALDRLPHDRATEGAARELLTLFRRRHGEWIPLSELLIEGSYPEGVGRTVLDTLVSSTVLEFRGGPPRYRYETDSLVELEIDRYLRRADRHSGMVQDNVARFRQRYH